MDLFKIRTEFRTKTLDRNDLHDNPFFMLSQWIKESIKAAALEPTAMTLSTVSASGKPSSRIVLLKEIKDDGLVFFTNYGSHKALEIEENGNVALNFCWHELERQVRVEGFAIKLNNEESDKYYNMRPEESKIGAWASPQSQIIPNRAFLNDLLSQYKEIFENRPITRPENWGGFIIKPNLFEFWQGRENRLHDRFQYKLIAGTHFQIDRLAP